MAVHKGSEGYVKVGLSTLAETQNWSLTETAETIDTSSMGDSARTYVTGLTTATGSMAVRWDETDTDGQGALTVGATVTLSLYVDDTNYATMDAIITEAGVNSTFDGLVEASYSFQVDGTVSWT